MILKGFVCVCVCVCFYLSIPDAKHPDKTWEKNPDVCKDPDVWCQVNKTSRIFTNFSHFPPDVWCHLNTVLICSIIITMFFNIICQYLNSFFTKLSLKILPFNSFKVGGVGTKGLFFPQKQNYNAQWTHNTRTPLKTVPTPLCWETLPISVSKWWRIIQLKWLKWQLNFNWHAYAHFNSGKSFRRITGSPG